MKPFDITVALRSYAANKPNVVTRDGRRVISLIMHPVAISEPISAVIEGSNTCLTYKTNGRLAVTDDDYEYDEDLFLVEDDRWVNIYFREISDGTDNRTLMDVFDNEQLAKENVVQYRDGWKYLTTAKFNQ